MRPEQATSSLLMVSFREKKNSKMVPKGQLRGPFSKKGHRLEMNKVLETEPRFWSPAFLFLRGI